MTGPADFSLTLPSERRDFVEWHRGRSPYVFWALDVDLPVVRERLVAAAESLAGRLLPDYFRQPHVTLDLCGFPAAAAVADDEFDAVHFAACLQRLQAAAVPPLTVEVGGPASFASAPYLTLGDRDGGIRQLRAALAGEAGNRLRGDYVPHVTIGLYAGVWPAAEVLAAMAGVPATPLALQLERLGLMAYAPAEIGGALDYLGDYDLRAGVFRWRGKPLF